MKKNSLILYLFFISVTSNLSGRVELFYDGKISNEVIWEDFEVNEILSDSLFIL